MAAEKNLKKALEAIAGISLLVAGLAMQQPFVTVAGIAEVAKIVAE